jgi:hypothetical protein
MGHILDDLEHPNTDKYPNQSILVMLLKIKNYVYMVPYVEDEHTIFLIRCMLFLFSYHVNQLLLKFRGSKKAKLTQQPIELKRKKAIRHGVKSFGANVPTHCWVGTR